MDDDQTAFLSHEVADFHHGHAVAGGSDRHRHLVIPLVRVVEDRVAQCMANVLIRYAMLARGREDLDPHPSKVTWT